MRRAVVLNLSFVLCLSLGFLVSGCQKKAPPSVAGPPETPAATASTPTPSPHAAVPSIEISALPSTVERGQESTLSWKSGNATSILIDQGVGNVAECGSIAIAPRQSTTFTATATGPGGDARDSTRVTVVGAKSGTIVSTDIEELQRVIDEGKVRSIFFEYDKAELSSESKRTLEENARWIRRFPNARVTIEGHCDERGTEEYNLALGDQRAQVTKDYLTRLAVNPSQVATVSYGEERPFDPGHDEAAWTKNRRAHFVARQPY